MSGCNGPTLGPIALYPWPERLQPTRSDEGQPNVENPPPSMRGGPPEGISQEHLLDLNRIRLLEDTAGTRAYTSA